jgi:N6-L-threonylcarbamoyladenine synthase
MLADGYAFSFSGLKTAVVNYVRKEPDFVVEDVAASFVAACMDVLCAKMRRALEEFGDPAIWPSSAAWPPARSCAPGPGCWPTNSGPAAHPTAGLATDNAAMIGIAGWQKFTPRTGPATMALRPRARPAADLLLISRLARDAEPFAAGTARPKPRRRGRAGRPGPR